MRTLYHHRRYKGVYPRGSRFIAAITHDGKTRYIGSYANEVDAANAYDLEAKVLRRDTLNSRRSRTINSVRKH